MRLLSNRQLVKKQVARSAESNEAAEYHRLVSDQAGDPEIDGLASRAIEEGPADEIEADQDSLQDIIRKLVPVEAVAAWALWQSIPSAFGLSLTSPDYIITFCFVVSLLFVCTFLSVMWQLHSEDKKRSWWAKGLQACIVMLALAIFVISNGEPFLSWGLRQAGRQWIPFLVEGMGVLLIGVLYNLVIQL